jgi:hypothetical protein
MTQTYHERINNAFPILACEVHRVDAILFQQWQAYRYAQLRTDMLKFLKTECPELDECQRETLCDERLFPIREHIVLAERLFNSEREIEASVRSAFLKLNSEKTNTAHVGTILTKGEIRVTACRPPKGTVPGH